MQSFAIEINKSSTNAYFSWHSNQSSPAILHCHRQHKTGIVESKVDRQLNRKLSGTSDRKRRKNPLDRKLYLSCLWPGLPELWWRGRISALPTALAFAAAINFLLIARFVYPEWLAIGLVRMAGWVAVAIWLFCVIRSIREMPQLINPRRASGRPDRFVDAHQAYLRGDWAEAESLLSDCLAIENRDPPALILLCGVYRHTNRLEAASRLLEEIRLTESADGWWLEVAAEQGRLDRDLNYSRSEGQTRQATTPQTTTTLPQPASDGTLATAGHAALAPITPSIALVSQSETDITADEVSESEKISVVDVVSEIVAELDQHSQARRANSHAA